MLFMLLQFWIALGDLCWLLGVLVVGFMAAGWFGVI